MQVLAQSLCLHTQSFVFFEEMITGVAQSFVLCCFHTSKYEYVFPVFYAKQQDLDCTALCFICFSGF